MREVYGLHGGAEPVHHNNCAHIRLVQPFTHPLVARSLRLTHGTEPPAGDFDLVFLDRFVTWPTESRMERLEAFVESLAARRIPLVYSLDDNLLDLHEGEPWASFPGEELRQIVRFLTRKARRLIVSTPALLERMASLNPDIVVVPNALDERLLGPVPKRVSGKRLTIGYMGTRTHDADLMTVLAPLREVLARYRGRVSLEFVGVSQGTDIQKLFKGLPLSFKDPAEETFYPRFHGWMRRNLRWDLGIAPLVENAFTRCKSDIKYLDYAALGVPGVFSDAPAYRDTVRHGETGFLAGDSRSWRDALVELIENGPLRESMRRRAQEEVLATRTLAQVAPRWVDALTFSQYPVGPLHTYKENRKEDVEVHRSVRLS